jgi:hypothetical protein
MGPLYHLLNDGGEQYEEFDAALVNRYIAFTRFHDDTAASYVI